VSKGAPTAPYDTNLICVNADLLATFHAEVGPAFFADRRSIAVWFWEIARFPAVLHHAFELVDEVWVASGFVRDSIARETSKPVHVVPLPIEPPTSPARTRSELGLPDGFLFLFSFDFLSIFERKNPLGLIAAYTQAFTPDGGAALVIKSINGDHDQRSLARLRQAAAGRNDIRVLDGYVSVAENHATIAACDCYVSLHRSEGYGLTMAEAMAHAKPVIATGYSGNLDFMTEENSYLVPYRLSAVPEGCEPYPAGAEWAEPDVAAASRLMRRVFENREDAGARGRRARDELLARFTLERTATFLQDRLDAGRVSPAMPTA
jgi:glycosyltransferase involved in cell wall biosynthesis